MRQAGVRLAILSQDEEGRALAFYRQLGWTSQEEVIVYRRPAGPAPAVPRRLALSPLTPSNLPALLTVEDAAFPWLWRFGASVFQHTSDSAGRRLFLAALGPETIGYVMYTIHGDFGHVDRLAVHPRHQSQGFGAELLAHALDWMARGGVASVGLSTQSGNLRSQRLYQNFGFRRTGEKYSIYGKWLTHDAPGETSGTA
jgi:ribosomal-protein-alanine N-acetyltransferase